MEKMPDIDIDFADRTLALEKFKHVTAAIKEDNTFKKHNTGIYCTSIPYNPLTGLSTIDYKTAEDRGYFKIDFLNVSVYEGVRFLAITLTPSRFGCLPSSRFNFGFNATS